MTSSPTGSAEVGRCRSRLRSSAGRRPPPLSNNAAVERLHARGIAFSICSSRPPFGMRMLIDRLRVALPFGGYNGGAILNPDFTIVEQKLIPADAAKEAVAVFQAHRIDCWLFVGNEWLVVNPTGAHVAHETRTIQTSPTIVPAFTEAHLAAAGKI